MRLTIDLTEEEVKVLKKRGKKNYLELKEMVEDIVRRSCMNAKNDVLPRTKVDDTLVDIFSRQRTGKQEKKKKVSMKELFWGEKKKKGIKRKKMNNKKNPKITIKSNKPISQTSFNNLPEPAFRDK